MKYFYPLVISLSVFFVWLMPKENPDSTANVSFNKIAKPTPKKIIVRSPKISFKSSNDLSVAYPQDGHAPLAPNITLVKSVAVQGGGNATPGGQLNYTVVLSNTASGVANNATSVSVSDVLNSNLTLVAGSVKATPIIVEDSYECIGNVGITVPANIGLLANDIDPLNLALQATVINQAGTQGTVVANPDGSFTFTPNVGYSGTTTFTYTATNGNFAQTATVSIVVSAPIWFVNNAAATNGNGTLASPFKDWSNFATANALTGASDPAANQTVFVYSGTYSGAATLKAGQKVLGQGATVGLASFAGATVQSYTNTLPTTSGTQPNLTSSGTTITLATGNTLRGFDMGNSTKDIVGSSFLTLTISEMALNGNGAALDLSSGNLAANFTNISSTDAASSAISLISITGNLTNSGSTTITNPTGFGIGMALNTSLVSSFGNTTINGSSSVGVLITSQNAHTTTFGSLNIAPDANTNAIQIGNNAGTITCTSGTMSSTNITAVNIIGANSTSKVNLNMTLTSVSTSGGQRGILIKDAAGSFTVTGTGTTAGSGGTLNNHTLNGVDLNNVSNITLRNMTLSNANTTDATLSTTDYSVSNGGIIAKDVSGLTLNNVSIAGSSQRGISGHNVSNFSMTNCTVNNSGDNVNEGAIAFTNLSGTCSITGSTITRANEHLINIFNTSVNLNLTISNSNISDTQTTPAGGASAVSGTGILANTFGSGKTYITVSNCTLNKIGTDAIKAINNNTSMGSYEITGCSIDPVNSVTQPNDVGTAIEITSNGTSTVYTNIHDNTKLSANGGNVVTIAPTEQSTIHTKFTNNTVTYKSGGIVGLFRGIEIFGQDDARGYSTITGNNISGLPQSNGIMVDNRSTLPTHAGNGRIDAIITGNTVALTYPDPNSTGRCIFIEAGNTTASQNIVCARVASNTTSTNGINGHFRLSTFGATSAIRLEGSTDAATAWNANGNTPNTGSGGIVSVRATSTVTMVAANTCIAPLDPPAFVAQLADNNQIENIIDENARVAVKNEDLKDSLTTPETLSTVESKQAEIPTDDLVMNATQNSVADVNAGETVTIAGAGAGFTLPAGKSTTITFSATISTTPSSCDIPNQATVSGSNFSNVNSNVVTTNVVVPAPTAVTPSSATPICIGQSVSLVATCSSGTVQWYNSAATGTLLGTTASLGTFTQSPTTNTTYQAACLIGGCESARVNTGLITVNPLPTITVSASPAICEGATSFTIPYTATTDTPTTYSISGTGITTVTDATLPATPITVNLSSAATGSSYSYTLTVKNANGCVSSDVTGSVTVNPIPSITTGASPAICEGATSFTVPYTSTTGTPTTYSISGTGITTVTNGTLTSSPIIVNLSSGASGSSISYTLTVGNTGGCISSDVTGSVTVNPLPTLTPSASPAICTGATSFTIPYTGTTGTPTTYSISGTGITTVTDAVLPATPITVNLSSGASGSSISYTMTVKNANGCTSSDITGSVTVNSLPTANPSNNSPICSGSTLNLNSTAGMTAYSWTGPNSFTSSIQAPTINDASAANDGLYSLTVTNSSGCTASATTLVSIATIAAPTSPTATPSSVTISGTTTTLTASGCDSPLTITWYDTANSTVALPDNTPVITATKTFFARCTEGTLSCTSLPSPSVTVTYNPCTPLLTSPGNVNITWTGLLDTDWNNACNWNPAWVPDMTNNRVIIPAVANDPIISSGMTSVKSILISGTGASLTVNSGATLSVSSDALNVLLVESGGVMTNNGTVNITNTEIAAANKNALQINNATVDNYGTLNITSAQNNGLELTGTFNNKTSSSLIINASRSIIVNDLSTMVNESGANMTLTSTNSTILLSNGSLTNSGTITSNGNIEKYNTALLLNNSCGRLIVTGDFFNNGTTTNQGYIQISGTLHNALGVFTNNGVLKYGLLNVSSTITNNKMVVTNTCPIFTLGGSNNYTVNGIFTDAGATTSAGTYTSVGNKFTANNTIPAGTQTLYASVSDGTCTFIVPFDFNNIKPTSVSISTTNACLGDNITLSATCTSGTVTWYGSAAGTTSLGTGGTFSYVPSAGTGQAFYAACETTNCVSGRTITSNFLDVILTPSAPTVTLTSQSIVCQPSTLNLTASGCAGTVTWSNNTTGTSLTLAAVGTYSISANCTVNGCTSDQSSAVNGLEIKAKPNAPTVTPPANLSVCSPSTLTLTASGCAGTVTWSNNTTGTSLTLSATGTYSISANCTVNGCTSDQSTAVNGLEIKAKPNTPTITPPANLVVCSPSTLTLTASGCAGMVTWSNNTTGTSLTLAATGTYSISANCTVNGCTSDQSSAVNGLVIKAKPSPPAITPPANISVCSPSILTLTASGCAGTVTWSNNTTGTSLTLAATGTYSISANCTVNGCTSDQSSAVNGLVIKAKPNAPTITPPANLVVCSPSTLTLTASGCAGMVTWSNNTTGTSLTLAATGTYSISANCTVNGCTSDQSTAVNGLVIKAKPNAPTVTPPANLSVCSPSTLTLTASGCAGTVTWSNNTSGTSLTLSAVGTYSISANCTVNGCISDQSTAVNGLVIKAKPNAPTVTPPANLVVCSPSTLTLTASGCAGMVTWSNNTTGTSLTLAATGTYSISANCTVNGCTSDQSTAVNGLVIKAKPSPPAITPPANLSVCSPSTLTLTANGCAGTVTWSNNTTGTSLTLAAVGTYSISANCTVNGCTSDQSTAVNGLVIKAKPSPPAITPPANLSVCSPSTLTLTASGCAGTVTWSNNATGTSLTLAAVGTYSISANCTVNGCTSDQSTAVNGLVIKAKPNAPTVTPPANLSVCSPSTLTLTASGCAGTVTWSNNATGTSLTLSAVGTYSISANCTVNGCTSDQSSAVNGLVIKAKPNAPTITPPANLVVCSPSTLTLTASGCAGMVTWSNNTTGTSLTLAATGTYSISANCTVNGCTSDQSTAVNGLVIKAKPSPPAITPPANLSVCSPSTLTLTASGCAGTVTWSNNTTGTSLTLAATGTYSISANCTVNGCISDQSTAVNGLEIKDKPKLPAITPPTNLSVCSPSTLTLTASGCAGTVTWSNNTTGTSLTLSAVGTYSISANCTVNGCTSDQSTAVNGLVIKAKPNAPTVTPPANLSVCSPSTLTLTASGCAGTVTWSNNTTGTSLTLAAVGTYSISANCTVNGCTSDQSTAVNGLVIKAKPNAPTVTPPANLVVCSPSTLTLTASGCAGMVTWSNNTTGTSLTLAATGTYSISANCTVNGCTSDQSTAVNGLVIKAKPNAPTVTPPANLVVCSPSTLTLTASGCAGMVTWSNNTTGTSLTLSAVGTYSISANCTVNGCTSDQSSAVNGLVIKAKPSPPAITPPANISVCSPSTLTLTASGCAGTVTWSNNTTGTSLTLAAVGTYSISANCTVNGCISDQSSAVNGLVIKAKPSPPAITPPANLSVCSPSTLTLTASGCAGTVTWSNNTTGTSLTLAATGTYSISANCTVNGCTSDQSTAVNGLVIKAKPSPPAITPPANLSVCSPSTLTLTASGCAGTVTWSNNTTGTSLTLSAVGTYSISANCTVNGCTSDQSTAVNGLVIKAKPSPPAITPPANISVCSPSTLTLTASGCAGTVTWSNNTTGTSLTLSAVGTYSISANCTVNGCTSDQSSAVNGLVIKAKPNAPTVTPPANLVVCSPSTLTLTASGCAGIVTWSNNTTGTSLTLAATGTYSISANCTVNGCTSDQSSAVNGLVIKAKPNAPTVTPPANLVVCSPSTLTLTASGCAGTVTWSNNTSGTSLTLAAVGTYSISANCTVNGCTSDQSSAVNGLEIKAKPSPPAITPPANLSVCSPSTLTLTASGCAGTVTWSNNTTGTSLTLAAVGTYSISANCTVNGCTSDQSSAVNGLEIKAKPNAPTITPPANLVVCSPSTLTLTASGCAGTVTWSNNTTGTSLTLAATGTYSISANCTVNGCTSDQSTAVSGLVIKAKPNAPTITPPANLVVCSPSTLTLTASGCAGTVTWSNNATGTSLTLAAVGTYSISANCTVNGCTSDQSTAVNGLVIKAKPSPPAITPPANLSVCSPSTLTLTASGCAGTVTWSNNTTGTSLTLAAVGTYSISANCTVNGCISDQSTAVNGLVIKAKPNAPTITPPANLVVCSPSTLTLTASGCAGTVTWSNNTTGTSLTLSAVGTYSISANCTVNGCISDQSTAVNGLVIKAKPSPPAITPPANLSVCSPSTLTLTASGCAGTVTWSNNTTGTSLTLAATGTYSISANCTVNGCTSDQSTAVNGLVIKAKPNAPTVTPPANLVVCSPSTLTLTASGCAGTVTWSNNVTGTSLTLSAVGTYSISANCTVNGCTSDQSSIVTGLEIKATPVITATNTGPYTVGQTISLTGTGAGNYNWTGPNNFSSTSSTPTIPSALSVNEGIYTLSVTGLNGCNAVATTNVIVGGIDPCDPSRIVDYLYVKAGNPYQALFPLTSGAVINQRTDQVSILLNPVCPSITIESFEMNIQGPELNWNILQNVSPYALFDNFGVDVWGRNFKPGNYTLTVTGYAQDNKGGGITYGPKVITFTVVGDLATINAPTLSKTVICAGSSVDVTFSTTGTFNGVNQFQVELSDSSGSFAAPVLIGTTNTTGTLNCTIPQSTFEGSKYLIRVTSTNQVVVGNPAMSLVTVHPFSYNLVSPTNNLTGTSSKKAASTINASNKVTSPANVTYQAGNSILLIPGFESGAVFKAEIQGCNN